MTNRLSDEELAGIAAALKKAILYRLPNTHKGFRCQYQHAQIERAIDDSIAEILQAALEQSSPVMCCEVMQKALADAAILLRDIPELGRADDATIDEALEIIDAALSTNPHEAKE